MKRKRFWISLLAGFMAALMVFGIIASILPAYAEEGDKTSDEIRQEIDALEQEKINIQAQISKLEGQISDNLNELKEMVAQKSVIDQQVFLLYQQIQNITKQITAYNDLIADKQIELDKATARWQELSDKYKERIRTMEEDGKLSYWAVLFRASSFSDFLDRLSMIEEIASSDHRRLEELNKAAQVVEDAKAGLEAEKKALESSKTQLEQTSVQLGQSQIEAENLLKQLLATGDEYRELINQAEHKESETAGRIDELEYQYDEAKKKEYEAWLESQKPPEPPPTEPPVTEPPATEPPATEPPATEPPATEPTLPPAPPTPVVPENGNLVNGVVWLTPIKYDYFTSPFGYRWHPIHGDWRFHYGVDLAAPTGRPIIATRSGMVTTTDYEEGGAGYYVSINHMDGFSSIYMHMTHYIVSPGQYVVAGQIIGYCGSTGGSTGPHLHFGIYYKGEAVNPADYIKIT